MFPRLLVVTDVLVTGTVAGSLQLYRLLGGYPADRLCICEGTLGLGQRLGGRLPGVRHVSFDSGSARWRRSRLVRVQGIWLALVMPMRASWIARAMAGFEPEVVLTVAQEFGCFSAAAFARRRGLPLHVILHDDWLAFSRLPAWFAVHAGRRFGRLYAQAAERWCISPSMEEYYRERWGVGGRVLLPVRDDSRPPQPGPIAAPDRLTIAYAGTVPTGGRGKLLLEFAEAIASGGHRLSLMVPGGMAAVCALAKKVGCQIRAGNIDDHGYVPSDGIVAALRDRADALLVAETFEPGHHDSIAYNFPSKLADYSAAGLPIIVWAPPYSSAARWARENREAAMLIDSEDPAAARRAVDALAADADVRRRMADAARAASAQFDLHPARERLYGAIADSARGHRGS
ncbi:MAG TPA: hypothetical protein PLU30_15695 [Verrucomicrobiae bacterium]|nr:hypothetical protein [Verrucomicrobiae bacterium]